MNEILIQGMRPVDGPTGVNKKIFHSVQREMSLTLIQLGSVLLTTRGNDDDLPSPSVAAILVGIFSHFTLELPELIAAEYSSLRASQTFLGAKKRRRLCLATLFELTQVGYFGKFHALTLLHRCVKTLARKNELSSDRPPNGANQIIGEFQY